MALELPSLILVDKPKGMSSFSVIRQLRQRTGIRKFGYAGTLDPLATGLLLIGVGKGTKQLAGLVGLDKEYIANVCVGEQRSTGDMEGEVINERPYGGEITETHAAQVVKSMIGEHHLPVSAYSAIKQDGVPMYKRARRAAKKGESLPNDELPVRRMMVYEAELLSYSVKADRLYLTVQYTVSSGTYVRSLAEELGRRLGYPATLSDLRRTKIGSYSVADASRLEDFGEGIKISFLRLLSRLRRRLGLGVSS